MQHGDAFPPPHVQSTLPICQEGSGACIQPAKQRKGWGGQGLHSANRAMQGMGATAEQCIPDADCLKLLCSRMTPIRTMTPT